MPNYTNNKVRIEFRVTPEERKLINEYAAKLGITTNKLVYALVHDYLIAPLEKEQEDNNGN